jgi:hypothetical protein
MPKPAQNKIADPWEVDIDVLIKGGSSPDEARAITIVQWMWRNDLRPLAAAIWKRYPLNEMVLGYLAILIEEHRVIVKPSRKGRPRKPDIFARNYIAGKLYLAGKGNSDARFAQIASEFGMPEKALREAVTQLRKHAG